MRRLNDFAKPVQACVFPVPISDCLNVSLFHVQKIANRPDPSSRVVIQKNTNTILVVVMVQVIICQVINIWLLIFHLMINVPNCKICFPCVNKTSCQYMIEFIYIYFLSYFRFCFLFQLKFLDVVCLAKNYNLTKSFFVFVI